MAATLAAAAGAAPRVKWQTSDYAFDPYALTAERLPPACDEKMMSVGGKAAAAALAALPVKRRPGRQKRTSVLCQVPGCEEELVDAKKYYRRYRICQLHCNMPSMMIEGRRQRFCQQCGRFHDIGEFEGAKRSCKRKLKRHNERRRTSGTTSGGKKSAATWQSDSEAEAEEQYHESSGGGGAKAASTTKLRPAARRPALGNSSRLAAKVAPAPVPMEMYSSGDFSAASHNTGACGGVDAAPRLSTDSPTATAQPAGPPGPALALAARSPSGSLASCMQQADAPDLRAAATEAAGTALGAFHAGSQQAAFPLACDLPLPLLSAQQQLAPLHKQPLAQLQLPPLAKASSKQVEEEMRTLAQHAASPAVTSAPASPLPATALAAAPTAAVANADLDSVLQQLLHDEELQGLQLDPLEMFMPQDAGAQMAIKPEPSSFDSGLPAQAKHRSLWGAPQQGVQFARSGVEDLPMELLDDIPLIPLPEELRPRHTSAGPSSGDASGATAVPTPSISSGSDMATGAALPLPSRTVAQDMASWQAQQAAQHALQVQQQAQQAQQLWRSASLTLSDGGVVGPAGHAPALRPMLVLQPQLQQQLSPSVAFSVLESVHSMLSMPSMVASGQASPLVGYGMQPTADTLTTLSLKVFSCTPDRLLPAVRRELEGLLHVGQTLLEGYIRPGCTQLTLNVLMPQQRAEELKTGGLGAMVTELLSSCQANDVLQQDMLVQFEGELAVVKRRKVVALIALKNSPALVPALAPLLPLAVHATAAAPAAVPLLLGGRHLTDDRDLILARQQGSNLTVEVHATGEVQGGEYAKVRLLGVLPGCAEVEVQHGSFLSAPRALLALPSQAAVAEVRQLERCTAGVDSVDGMLRDMGLVVQFLQRHELQAEGLPCPDYTPALLAAVAGRARRLVAAAVARGWTAVTQMLLPAVTADGQPACEAVAAMNACCPPSMTLLHVAVGTGSVALVQCLAAWAAQTGSRWDVDAHGGAAGITPLHVAALLPNSAEMRAALTAMTPATTKLWGLVQASDGTTPEALAEAMQAPAAGAAAAAGPDAASSAASGSSAATAYTRGREGSSAAAAEVEQESGTAGYKGASTSKAGAEPEGGLSALSGSSRATPLQEASTGRSKSKGGAEEEASCPASFTAQRRRGRQAMKQHLDDMHMTTILSEVEGRLDTAVARDPRPLADVLSSTVAAGAALLRVLRRGGE